MKALAALFLLIAAAMGLSSLFNPAHGQGTPCQWNYAFVNDVATATYCGEVVTQGGIIIPSVNTVASIAQLEALAVPQISQGSVWTVLGYHTSNDGGGGQFVLAPGACNNSGAGDGGTQFPSTITATCWTRLGITTVLTAKQFGAYGDNVHDDTTSIQNMETAAYSLSTIAFYPAGHYKVLSQITASQGVANIGAGWTTAPAGFGTPSPTIIDASSAANPIWVFDLENPNGVSNIQAPTFYNMSIYASSSATTAGGCIRWNNPNHGFTDDNTSQEAMASPVAYHIYCSMQNVSGNSQIGLQCSKCFAGDWSGNVVQFGGTAADIEGSDQFTWGAKESNTFEGQTSYIGIINSHNTFGNVDTVYNTFFSNPQCDSQNGLVYLSGREDSILNSYMESGCSNILSDFYIPGGFHHTIRNNDLDASVTNTLLVTTNDLTGLTWSDNHNSAGPMQSASFPSGSLYYYNSSIRQRICHHDNTDGGDYGFSMNCIPSNMDIQLPFKTVRLFSCDTEGLNYEQDGETVACMNESFYLTNAGSYNGGTGTHNLKFSSAAGPQPTITSGTYDLWLYGKADCSSGGDIEGLITDNDVLNSGTPASFVPTLYYSWFETQSNISISTLLGAAIYKGGSSACNVSVKYVALVQH